MEAIIAAETKPKEKKMEIKMSKAMVEAVRVEVNKRVAGQADMDTLLAFNRIMLFEQQAAKAIFTGYMQTFVVTQDDKLWAFGCSDASQIGFGKVAAVNNPRSLAMVIWSPDMAPIEARRSRKAP